MAPWRGPVIRYEHNPILTKQDVPYEVETVHNAAVTKMGDRYVMVFRSHLRSGRSILGVAESLDGFRFVVRPEPFMTPATQGSFATAEEYGVEDPRITYLEGRYYITYSAYSRQGVRIGLAVTDDFTRVERVAMITEPDHRNVVLFPARFGGRFARLDRPHSHISKWSIWLSYSPDLVYWGDSQALITPAPYHWDEMKIGPGAPPLLTDRGWLVIYHGAFETMAGRCLSTWRHSPGEGESLNGAGGCRRLDPATRRSVGSHRLRAQRGVLQRRRPGAGWQRQTVLGWCRFSHVHRLGAH